MTDILLSREEIISLKTFKNYLMPDVLDLARDLAKPYKTKEGEEKLRQDENLKLILNVENFAEYIVRRIDEILELQKFEYKNPVFAELEEEETNDIP